MNKLLGVAVFGAIAIGFGFAAWSGLYRGWTRLVFGSFLFMGLPAGIGFELIAIGAASGIRIIGLIGIGFIVLVAVPVAFIAPEVIGPAWYPGSRIRIGRR